MTDVECLVKVGDVMGTSCQAEERGEKLKLGKQTRLRLASARQETRRQKGGGADWAESVLCQVVMVT